MINQTYYATLISTIGSSRLNKTRAHLHNLGVQYREDLQPSERRPAPTNGSFALTRWEAFTYKQTDINMITTRRHLEVLQHAIEFDLFPHMILEDDVRFTSKSDLTWGIGKAMKTRYPWNICLLSCITHPVYVRIPIGLSNMHYVPTPLMAHAYLITKRGAQKMMELSITYEGLAYDKLFRHLGRCVGIWPEIAYQCVNPHQLQAIIQSSSGGDWLLTMSNAVTLALSMTIICGIIILSLKKIAKNKQKIVQLVKRTKTASQNAIYLSRVW